MAEHDSMQEGAGGGLPARTLRISLAGLEGAGQSAAMARLRELAPDGSRGELVTIPSGSDTLLALDLSAKGPGRDRGLNITLRLIAGGGPVRERETLDRLVARADGVLFFASDSGDSPELIDAWDAMIETVRHRGRDPDALPKLLLAATRDSGELAADRVGVPDEDVFVVDADSGRGLARAVAALVARIIESGVEEADAAGADDRAEQSGDSGLNFASRDEDEAGDEDLFTPPDSLISRRKSRATFEFSSEQDDVSDDTPRPRGLFSRLMSRRKSRS
ncbi:MAG: hypothetical protein MAG453_02032 [Calditrichaeota bacterium]|nr:hypothetical protein [Calditrichota bacterium]